MFSVQKSHPKCFKTVNFDTIDCKIFNVCVNKTHILTCTLEYAMKHLTGNKVLRDKIRKY